ncbi:hypothetical protein [Nonomuraea sp. NPDC049141]|uniref:hypothetical protein n=1 Tax=Nonomuraea sp. NPDC049141 TaxID=3155500 RepID=UPI0033D47A74
MSEQDFPTIDERIWRVTGALSTYVAANPDYVWDEETEAPCNVEDAFVDLLADIFHLAARFEISDETLCDRAQMHFQFEAREAN